MSAVEDRLAEITALADAATSGPWEAFGPYIEAAGEEFAEVSMDVDGSDDESAPIDAAFIAAARTDVPVLVAALRAALREADPDDLVIGAAAWVAGYQDAMSDVRARVAAALVVTP